MSATSQKPENLPTLPTPGLASGPALWMPFLLLLVSLFALVSYTAIIDKQDDLRNAEISTLNDARVLSVRLEDTLNRIDAILQALNHQIPERALTTRLPADHQTEVTQILRDNLHLFQEVSGAWIVNRQGDVIYGYGADFPREKVNFSDRPYFRLHLNEKAPQLYISPVLDGKILKKQIIVFTRALRAVNGDFLGVAIIAIALENFQRQFSAIDVGKRGSVAIRRSDNLHLIVRWPHLPNLVNQPLIANDPIGIQIKNGKREFNSRHHASADNEIRVFGIVRLENYPFYVAVAFHEYEILEAWRKRTLMLAAAVALVGVLSLLLMWRLGQSQRRERRSLQVMSAQQNRISMLASAFETGGEAIMLVSRDGLVEEVNQYCSHLTGYASAEWIQQPWQYFFELENGQTFPATADIQTVWKSECLCRHSTGDSFPVLLTIARVMIAQRNEYHLVINFIDITERRKADQLKSDFVAVVSHELRTPLTSICGALGLINGGTVGIVPKKIASLLHLAEKNSLRLKDLINDLLDIEKLEAGKLSLHCQSLSVAQALEQAIESMQTFATSNEIRFFLSTCDPGWRVFADPVRMQQILANLLSNAVKFSPPGGQVELKVERLHPVIRFTVIDHGSGIAGNFRGKIFQKFAQAEQPATRRHGGTGLGLSITKELVERMGGRIGFFDTEGQGASFWFELSDITIDAAEPPVTVSANNHPS